MGCVARGSCWRGIAICAGWRARAGVPSRRVHGCAPRPSAPGWRTIPGAGAAMWLNSSARISSSSPRLRMSMRWPRAPAPICCPNLQGADGRHHLARQEQAHQHRQPQPQEQQHGIAQERGVEGAKALQGRARNTDQAHRGDGGVGRQSRSAEQIWRGQRWSLERLRAAHQHGRPAPGVARRDRASARPG